MKHFSRLKWLYLIVFLSIITLPAAFAAEDGVTVLDTVIVTGSGTKETLLDTNAAITVLTKTDIQNSGQSKTSELISSIPGVINQKAGSKTYFSIRGTRGSLSEGAVIYVDGRPINTGMYGYSKIDTIPLDNIEKIEVIKSPPASLYGGNSARGAILITTKSGKNAQDLFHGNISAEYGSWDTKKVTAGISGMKDSFDYSLSAYSNTSDGYRHTNDETESADTRIGYLFDGGRLDFIAGVNDAYTTHATGLTLAQATADRRSAGYMASGGYYVPPSRTDQEMVNAGLRLDYHKNAWILNSSFIYTRDNEIYTEMEDFNNPNANSKRDDYRDDRLDTQYDLKLSGGREFDLGEEKKTDTLILGVDYKHSDFEQERCYPFNTLAESATMTANRKKADMVGEKSHLGLNLNNDLSWDKFGLQTGVRLNTVSYDLKNQTPSQVKVDYDGDVDYTVSPSYGILEKANLFVTYNHSNFYMPLGHYKLDMEYNQPEAQAKDLKPEIYNTWEAGFKHQLHTAFNYSIIYYYTTIEDKVGSLYVGSSFKGYRNAGDSIHQGIEIEADGRLLPWFGYRIGFTTINAEWDKGSARGYLTPTAASVSNLDLAGKTVHYVPEYEYSAGLDFFPFRDTPYGSLTVSLDVNGFGEQYEDYYNNLKMDSATFADLKLAWTHGKFEWYLACTNLFDKEWDKIGNATGMAHSRFTGGTTGIFPQDGRYIGAGVSFKF